MKWKRKREKLIWHIKMESKTNNNYNNKKEKKREKKRSKDGKMRTPCVYTVHLKLCGVCLLCPRSFARSFFFSLLVVLVLVTLCFLTLQNFSLFFHLIAFHRFLIRSLACLLARVFRLLFFSLFCCCCCSPYTHTYIYAFVLLFLLALLVSAIALLRAPWQERRK